MINVIKVIHPRNILIALDQIDDEQPSYSLTRKQALRRVFSILACVSVCLLLIHYMKLSSSFRITLTLLSNLISQQDIYLENYLRSTKFFSLIGYAWWTLWHVIGYLVIPYFVIKYIMREPMLNMGWKLADTKKHWAGYVLLISPILFFIFLVSFRGDFLNHYPFYKMASRSWLDLIAWECLYLIQFLTLEFFFRGFILNGLRPALGANAIWIMCVPYLMIHLPKLWLEATGAILFGLFLGILAIKSRSIWGGFLVHAGIAITMDVTSLAKQGIFPTKFLPL